MANLMEVISLLNYDTSFAIGIRHFSSQIDSAVANYDHRMFIRLVTGVYLLQSKDCIM